MKINDITSTYRLCVKTIRIKARWKLLRISEKNQQTSTDRGWSTQWQKHFYQETKQHSWRIEKKEKNWGYNIRENKWVRKKERVNRNSRIDIARRVQCRRVDEKRIDFDDKNWYWNEGNESKKIGIGVVVVVAFSGWINLMHTWIVPHWWVTITLDVYTYTQVNVLLPVEYKNSHM